MRFIEPATPAVYHERVTGVGASKGRVQPGSSVATVSRMELPTLLQTGPETFQVLSGDGHPVTAILTLQTRRGLGVSGVPPLTVATEVVRYLQEHGIVVEDQMDLGAAAGRHVGAI